jgi:hypothetical protein
MKHLIEVGLVCFVFSFLGALTAYGRRKDKRTPKDDRFGQGREG